MTTVNFPNCVGRYPARGVPGDKASGNSHVYAGQGYVAEDAGVRAGHFVWARAANMASSSGMAGMGQPLGLVERVIVPANQEHQEPGLTLPLYAPLSVVLRGDMLVVADTAASRGDKVFAVLADGGLRAAPAGETVSGAVETSWEVTMGGEAGELITISNWSV